MSEKFRNRIKIRRNQNVGKKSERRLDFRSFPAFSEDLASLLLTRYFSHIDQTVINTNILVQNIWKFLEHNEKIPVQRICTFDFFLVVSNISIVYGQTASKF